MLQVTTAEIAGPLQQVDLHVACAPSFDPTAADPAVLQFQLTARASGTTHLTPVSCAIAGRAVCTPPAALDVPVGS